jgi:hypothetical protein
MSQYVINPPLIANGNILPYSFVDFDLTTDYRAVQSGVGSFAAGVAQQGSFLFPDSSSGTLFAGIAGKPVNVFGPGAIVPITYNATITRGMYLKSDATGYAIPAVPGDIPLARAIESGAAGEVRRVRVMEAWLETPETITTTAVNLAIATGGVYQASAADLVFTLPPVATNKGQFVTIQMTATTAALAAGAVGVQFILNAADTTAKVIGNGVSVPVANKGNVNTFLPT